MLKASNLILFCAIITALIKATELNKAGEDLNFLLLILRFFAKKYLIKILVHQESNEEEYVEKFNDFDDKVVFEALFQMLTSYRIKMMKQIQRKSIEKMRLWKIRM
jgi:hypothetical protein